MPNAVDADDPQAEMNDGLLTVSIPKVREVQPKRVQINERRGKRGQSLSS